MGTPLTNMQIVVIGQLVWSWHMFLIETYGYGKYYMVVIIYMVVISTYINGAIVYISYIIYDRRLGILYYDCGKVVM